MSEIDWEKEEVDALRRYEEKTEQRRITLDNYEEKRKLELERFEKQKLSEIEGVAKARQEALETMLKEQEERLRRLQMQSDDHEQRMSIGRRELERTQERLLQEAKVLEDRRAQMKEDQEVAQAHLTRVSEAQSKALEEMRKENDELQRRYLTQVNEVAALKQETQQLPAIAKVAAKADHLEKKLEQLEAGNAFASSPQFAPVLAWLVGIGMSRYSTNFAEHEYDLHAAATLKEADLDHMGIVALGPRRRLIFEARALQTKIGKAGIAVPDAPGAAGAAAGLPALLPDNGLGQPFTLKQVLTDFYGKYDTTKVGQVDSIFHQFHGQYDALFATVASIYPLYFPSPFRERAVVVLQKCCPALLPAVDVLLDLHQGREVELLGDLLRASNGIPPSLTPGVGALPPPPASDAVSLPFTSPRTVRAPSVTGVAQTLATLLAQQGTPHPLQVAEVLATNFTGYEDQLLRAFQDVSSGTSDRQAGGR